MRHRSRRYFDPRIPMPPDPGGKHSNHYVQEDSLAAYRAYQQFAPQKQLAVMEYLESRGWEGALSDEGWRDMNCDSPNNYAPVVTALKQRGLVVWRGDHRKTQAGNYAKIWVTAKAWVQHHLALLEETDHEAARQTDGRDGSAADAQESLGLPI